MVRDVSNNRRFCRKNLPGLLAAILASNGFANTLAVTNCDDSGPGSLRAQVSLAGDGDTVDLTGVGLGSPACPAGVITLVTGDIQITQGGLSIVGPGQEKLRVTNGQLGGIPNPRRIFTAYGSTLAISDITISGGKAAGGLGIQPARGGCIYSTAALALSRTTVTQCTARDTIFGAGALGGAIYAKNGLTLNASTITGNTADGQQTGSMAGGLFVLRDFSAQYSTIADNRALDDFGLSSNVGGLYVYGFSGQGETHNVIIENSTIANNSADTEGGGLAVVQTSGTNIINSTISGNDAPLGFTGGVVILGGTTTISNSTIVFNTARDSYVSGQYHPAGVNVVGDLNLQNSIVASNTFGPLRASDDLRVGGGGVTTGHNNLVFAPESPPPPDTIVGTCPRLGSLRMNGGPTATHSLQSASPAIDGGQNIINLLSDQRGVPYARNLGASVDIGSYELDKSEIIFTDNLDDCP